ncbi:hypothetical protein [Paraburkholderia phosphatilytica]|uniref:hypothetical protein n=1 Tax=Paraburkholderia phosphatilytica TaxID=2282883 RepID=UPI001F0C3766|nr:hypothetical protein [Paraburkholderia phosphatilytica]
MPFDIDMEIVNEYGPNSLLLKAGGASAMLDAAELDELIELLATVRSELQPMTPVRPALTHQYVIETAPHWQTVRNPLFDGLIVFFRHSGFGWTGFGLPRPSIERLMEIMAPLVAPRVTMPESTLVM